MDILERKTAKLLNLTRYFTGKPCKHGHYSERRTSSGQCIECRNLAKQKYRLNNPLKVSEYKQKYYYAHKEQIIKDNTAYNKKRNNIDPERRKKYDKKYRDNNSDKRIRYLKLQPNAIPIWSEKLLIARMYDKRKALSKLWEVVLHVDHIVPLQGKNVCGLHCWDNLQLLEASLNISKYNNFED